jgi:hypothetical protein
MMFYAILTARIGPLSFETRTTFPKKWKGTKAGCLIHNARIAGNSRLWRRSKKNSEVTEHRQSTNRSNQDCRLSSCGRSPGRGRQSDIFSPLWLHYRRLADICRRADLPRTAVSCDQTLRIRILEPNIKSMVLFPAQMDVRQPYGRSGSLMSEQIFRD